jgi:glucose-6-phosphate dehydrogenase assembly protein OpcA
MPTTYKVLGQVAPSATTLTTLYTAPASTQAVVSTISVCNQSASATTFRIAIRVAGAAISGEDYIAYDSTISANNTTFITVGITLNATDVISVYSTAATVSFNAFGSEIS